MLFTSQGYSLDGRSVLGKTVPSVLCTGIQDLGHSFSMQEAGQKGDSKNPAKA